MVRGITVKSFNKAALLILQYETFLPRSTKSSALSGIHVVAVGMVQALVPWVSPGQSELLKDHRKDDELHFSNSLQTMIFKGSLRTFSASPDQEEYILELLQL